MAISSVREKDRKELLSSYFQSSELLLPPDIWASVMGVHL